jgi:predicted DCC family thiol-disulfide oxidoreductase YuxK
MAGVKRRVIDNMVLIFNGDCGKCSSLANLIDDLAPAPLELVSIHDRRAAEVLDEAFPSGWRFAPYLVVERN